MTQPTMKMYTKTIHEVKFSDLNDFISSVYGIDFDIVADCQLRNNTSKVLLVEKEEEFDKWHQETLDRARLGNCFPMYSIDTIMLDLCKRNLIPEGEYLILVVW